MKDMRRKAFSVDLTATRLEAGVVPLRLACLQATLIKRGGTIRVMAFSLKMALKGVQEASSVSEHGLRSVVAVLDHLESRTEDIEECLLKFNRLLTSTLSSKTLELIAASAFPQSIVKTIKRHLENPPTRCPHFAFCHFRLSLLSDCPGCGLLRPCLFCDLLPPDFAIFLLGCPHPFPLTPCAKRSNRSPRPPSFPLRRAFCTPSPRSAAPPSPAFAAPSAGAEDRGLRVPVHRPLCDLRGGGREFCARRRPGRGLRRHGRAQGPVR